jgi:hypothetical protein
VGVAADALASRHSAERNDRYDVGAMLFLNEGPTSNVAVTDTSLRDIIFGVMWSVELKPEVEQWIDNRTTKEFAAVLPHIERLADRGSQLRMPASRSLGGGLLELRLDLQRVAWRITYYFAAERRIVLLTVFRKQRQNERVEVPRARRAMERCIAEGHTAEEDE